MLVVAATACAVSRRVPQVAPTTGDPGVAALLESARVALNLPGAVAAISRDGTVTSAAAVGFRSLDTLESFAVNDPVHLGSATKAMTATVVSTLVKDEVLSWEDEMTQVFVGIDVNPGYAGVTLADLATHRGRLARDPSPGELSRLDAIDDPIAQRAHLAALALRHAPSEPRSDGWSYSNVGYMLLGTAIESATGKQFERVVQERLFDPLGMQSCGFYSPGSNRQSADAPRGHRVEGAPMPPGAAGDLHSAYAPAGLIHCSVIDWARFVDDQIEGEGGQGKLLPQQAYRRLHAPPRRSDYAFGWYVAEAGSLRGRVLSHSGSNGYWKSMVQVYLDEGTSVFLSTNVGVADRDLQPVLRDLELMRPR
jgi:CubicO group peptidase (beta-lactamase class C family)